MVHFEGALSPLQLLQGHGLTIELTLGVEHLVLDVGQDGHIMNVVLCLRFSRQQLSRVLYLRRLPLVRQLLLLGVLALVRERFRLIGRLFAGLS